MVLALSAGAAYFMDAYNMVIDSFDNRVEKHFDTLQGRKDHPYSHDNLFHTVLGMMEVESTVYDSTKDMFLN